MCCYVLFIVVYCLLKKCVDYRCRKSCIMATAEATMHLMSMSICDCHTVLMASRELMYHPLAIRLLF